MAPTVGGQSRGAPASTPAAARRCGCRCRRRRRRRGTFRLCGGASAVTGGPASGRRSVAAVGSRRRPRPSRRPPRRYRAGRSAGAAAPAGRHARSRRRVRWTWTPISASRPIRPGQWARTAGLRGGLRERGRAAGVRRDRSKDTATAGGGVDQAGRRRVRRRPADADGARHLGPGHGRPDSSPVNRGEGARQLASVAVSNRNPKEGKERNRYESFGCSYSAVGGLAVGVWRQGGADAQHDQPGRAGSDVGAGIPPG